MRNYLGWLFFFFVAWWIMLLPYHYDLLSVLLDPIHAFFYNIITQITGPIPFHSDSSGMYLLLLICPILGAITAIVTLLPVVTKLQSNGFRQVKILMTYFLVLELWKYGWIKLVKLQFYLPEPNILYTRLGDLSKDMAYWSVIGSSHSYVVFLGLTELFTGILLLFQRTRFVGLLLTFGIFINVLMVNISFDISVKLFALTSLLMIITALTDYSNQFRYLFQLPINPTMELFRTKSKWKQVLKAFVLSIFVMEMIYPSVIMESMNDDTVERIAHHGAYKVTKNKRLKYLYVHRQGYVIAGNHENALYDFRIIYETGNSWTLLDERSGKKSSFVWKSPKIVIWKDNERTDTLTLTTLPYRKLPLLKDSFHWISDGFH